MITKKTVLVLGAGASMPFHFPSGDSLVDSVKTTLKAAAIARPNIVGPGTSLGILRALGYSLEEIRQFGEDLNQAQTRSVDAFLERRQQYVGLGKAVMAMEIQRHETWRALFLQRNHWYQFLLDMIDAPLDEISSNQLSIVTYNYDRSLEAYLVYALSARTNMPKFECAAALSAIPIVHVHGSLGKLKWAENDDGLPYDGGKPNADTVSGMAANMIVIHEGQDDSIEYRRAIELMNEADRIYCLGFGYGATNLLRLKLHDQAKLPGRVVGSYKSLSSPERRRIEGTGFNRIQLVQCHDCLDFIREVDLD